MTNYYSSGGADPTDPAAPAAPEMAMPTWLKGALGVTYGLPAAKAVGKMGLSAAGALGRGALGLGRLAAFTPAGQGALTAAAVMQPVPANAGEVPQYIKNSAGQYVPNPASIGQTLLQQPTSPQDPSQYQSGVLNQPPSQVQSQPGALSPPQAQVASQPGALTLPQINVQGSAPQVPMPQPRPQIPGQAQSGVPMPQARPAQAPQAAPQVSPQGSAGGNGSSPNLLQELGGAFFSPRNAQGQIGLFPALFGQGGSSPQGQQAQQAPQATQGSQGTTNVFQQLLRSIGGAGQALSASTSGRQQPYGFMNSPAYMGQGSTAPSGQNLIGKMLGQLFNSNSGSGTSPGTTQAQPASQQAAPQPQQSPYLGLGNTGPIGGATTGGPWDFLNGMNA